MECRTEHVNRVLKILTDIADIDEAKTIEFLLDYLEDACKVPMEELPTVEDRKGEVTVVTEYYYDKFETYPPEAILKKYGDYLLLDYIRDIRKSKEDENSFLSPPQLKRRRLREVPTVQHLDFLNSVYNDTIDLGVRGTRNTKGCKSDY